MISWAPNAIDILEQVATEHYEYDTECLYDAGAGDPRPNGFSFGDVKLPTDFDPDLVADTVTAPDTQFHAYRSVESAIENTVESVDVDEL